MFNENLIGFSCEKEFLPKDFDEFNSQIRLRQMFLNLSNNILHSYCHFSKYEQKKLSSLSLQDAFIYKIKSVKIYLRITYQFTQILYCDV